MTTKMMYYMLLLVILGTLLCGIEASSHRLSLASAKIHSLVRLQGGAKAPGLVETVRAFWLTLIDPSNDEALKESKKGDKKGSKKAGPFGSKPKGRKLGDK